MNTPTTALAGLIVATSVAGGAALTAQAHPSHLTVLTGSHPASHVAVTRLHALLQTHSTGSARSIHPDDGGVTHV